ncbi:MAG: hypothetical protein ACI9UO_000521 [Nitrospinales bacterium]|jgi:hypothetical protein
MLISPIDRNDETGPEKQISRINSLYWTLPTGVGLGTSPKVTRLSSSSEGMVLRVRDTRLMERRRIASQFLQPERRKTKNRKHDSRWNPDSHHILVIAIERQPGQPDLWKNGDRVTVVPQTQKPLTRPQEGGQSTAESQKNRLPLFTKDDEDYVVHLSGKSPTDTNEKNR